MKIEVKNIIGIFTLIDGKINLITHNSNLITILCDDDINLVNSKFINKNLNIDNIDLKQCYTFSNKNNDTLTLSILFTDIVNTKDIKLNDEYEFTPIDTIDKNIYIEKLLECLKKELSLTSNIKKLYPSEFILPEMQRLYETLYGKKIDRRNFRKKLIKLGIIESVDSISIGKTGRPAKTYKFNELKEDKYLF